MYCSKCGEQIPGDARFCAGCGVPVDLLPVAKLPTYPVGEQAAVPNAPRKKSKALLIVAACVVVLGCAILIPILIERPKAAHYKQAIALMQSGEAAQALKAQESFNALGKYKDAADYSKDCQKILDYAAAKVSMNAGDYAQAKQALIKLGNYEKAATLAAKCQDKLDYDAAAALMAENNYEAAADAFLALGDYEDAPALAADCKNRLDYDAAKTLLDNKNFEAALPAFTALGDYKDAVEQAQICKNKRDYNLADAAFEAGRYYSAFISFTDLGDYLDSAARAKACIQPYPPAGELYHSAAFTAKGCSLTIVSPSDALAAYLKFYSDADELVSTLFVPSGKKAVVKLPAGTYKIKAANGKNWFGPQEMFGDLGSYRLLTFFNDATMTTLKSGISYKLSLQQLVNGDAGSNNVAREGF